MRTEAVGSVRFVEDPTQMKGTLCMSGWSCSSRASPWDGSRHAPGSEGGDTMDPDATMNDLIDAVLADDFDAANDCIFELRIWRSKGGFKPSDPRS